MRSDHLKVVSCSTKNSTLLVIMIFIFNIIRFQRWRLLLIIGIIFLYLGIEHLFNALRPNVIQLTELHKCPACYGLSACDDITNNKVKITYLNAYSVFANLFGTKNVFFGTNQKYSVVLKKLARTTELETFDEILCSEKDLMDICPKNTVKKANLHNIDFYRRIRKEITFDFATDRGSNLRLCPTSDRMDNLFYNVYANSGKEEKRIFQTYLWILIRINPEPLILQILPADEGWPVPKYLGACGRLIMEEYIGYPLTTYHWEPWLRRAKIASNLLKAAQMFTFRSTDFGFYLTDVSPDNIAVDLHDETKFIDLENIIIVDKKVPVKNRSEEWQELQVNDADFNCKNCLAFSPTDICSHHLSDHNYYAICQHILAQETSASSIPGGLLHDIPADILKRYPALPYLIKQCAIPDAPHTRIIFGNQLQETLNTIIEKERKEYRKK